MNRKEAPGVGEEYAPGSVAGAIFFLLAGPILWSGHFFLVYGPQSALCAFGASASTSGNENAGEVTALVIAVSLVVLSAQLILLLRPHRLAALLRVRLAERQATDFVVSVFRFLTALSMLSVAWSGLAALLLEACGQLR